MLTCMPWPTREHGIYTTITSFISLLGAIVAAFKLPGTRALARTILCVAQTHKPVGLEIEVNTNTYMIDILFYIC
jgi:hypothetical protein